MADIFTGNTTYISVVPASLAGSTRFVEPGGRSTQGVMRTNGGKHYYILDALGTSNPYLAQFGCVENGDVVTLSDSDFLAQTGLSFIETSSIIPVPNTNIVYVFATRANGLSVNWTYFVCTYQINDDNTLTLIAFTTHDTPFGRGLSQDQNIAAVGYLAGETVLIGDYAGIGGFRDGGMAVLNGSISDWAPLGGMDPGDTSGFWDWVSLTINGNSGGALFIPQGSGGFSLLCNINQSAFDFMQTNADNNPIYPTFTNPGIWEWNDGIWSDVSAQFPLTDRYCHLDGSATTDYRDDYIGIYGFIYHGTQYVILNRSYVQSADLNTEGHGTYCHTVIYSWNGTTATEVYNDFGSLFDTVTDVGGAPGSIAIPDFVMIQGDADDLFYIWGYGGIGNPSQNSYVAGKLVHLEHTDPPGYNLFFSEFRQPNYKDWDTAAISQITNSADYSSELVTWYMLSDDSALWMEAPWVLTYLDNDTDPDSSSAFGTSLLMTPRWDWSDGATNHKFGPTQEMYHTRAKQAVSDYRTKVRGKGRALSLKFESSTSKAFNLLGWSIVSSKETQP